MRKAITIAIVIAMAAPVVMTAENIQWDFEDGCPPLEIIKANILDNDITFVNSTYRSQMLTAINTILSCVDNAQWSTAYTASYTLGSYCDTYIDDDDVAYNIANILEAIADEYDSGDPETFFCCEIDSDDAGFLDDGTEDGCLMSIDIEKIPVHKEACREKYRKKWGGWHHFQGCTYTNHWIFHIDWGE